MQAPSPAPGSAPEPESYRKIVASPALVLAVLAALAIAQARRLTPVGTPAPSASTPAAAAPSPVAVAEPAARPAPPPPPAPELDREAVARGEAELAAARRDRERAERRAETAAAALEVASTRSAAEALAGRTLAERVRDPGARIARAMGQEARLRDERDKLEGEVAALARAPKPKRKPLVDRTPVARPAEGDEYHFELRRNRVSFIDLDRLLDRVKADAKLRIRMSDDGRPVTSSVGPVGSFSLRYELGRSIPLGVEDLFDPKGVTYSLRSWEIVPEFEGRGEPFERAFQPASEFARAISRLTPERATITMWVYPDGFALYRKLRAALHARGFLVAARPLPEAMPIRGSPAGSLSAGQ